MKSIIESFPYPTARRVQEEVLLELEKRWNDFDIFVIVAPTATGKTALSKTLMNHYYGVSTIVPTNQLVRQFVDEFPDTRKLMKASLYRCEEMSTDCGSVQKALRGRTCGDCAYQKDFGNACYRKGAVVSNYYMYNARRIHRRVLVVDEAHNLAKVCTSMQEKVLWQHEHDYPSNMYSYEQIEKWLSRLPKSKFRKGSIFGTLRAAVTEGIPRYVVGRTMREWLDGGGVDEHGNVIKRGTPEMRDCLYFYPLDPSRYIPRLIPEETQKVILLSGTISRADIEELGLNRGERRICYLHCASPIPPERRPVELVNLVSVNRKNLDSAVDEICGYLFDVLLPRHETEKGVVHVTYQMSEMLEARLGTLGGRLLFHDKKTKQAVYEAFRRAPADSGVVLVACGMYEGIDLPDDLGRWQAVAKTPWKSLGDPAIRWKVEETAEGEEWYAWQAMRDLIQACGRICRNENDFGVTYLLDASSERLLMQHEHLVPEWFREALVNRRETE